MFTHVRFACAWAIRSRIADQKARVKVLGAAKENAVAKEKGRMRERENSDRHPVPRDRSLYHPGNLNCMHEFGNPDGIPRAELQ